MTQPNIIMSDLSRKFLIEGEPFKFEIYSLESENGWTLEVIDSEGTSTVWQEEFVTDQAAHACLMYTLEKEGIAAFKDGKVIPFPK